MPGLVGDELGGGGDLVGCAKTGASKREARTGVSLGWGQRKHLCLLAVPCLGASLLFPEVQGL